MLVESNWEAGKLKGWYVISTFKPSNGKKQSRRAKI
jgi:hypothetical protein